MRMKLAKKWKCLALAALFFGVGSTTAYFSSYDQVRNTVAVGNHASEIEEYFPTPTPQPIEENPEFEKTVWVTNVSGGEEGFSVDCFVRVSLAFSDYDIGNAVEFKNMDMTNWNYNSEDGYYYYVKPLKEGERTTPLFTGFTIDASRVDKTYLDKMEYFSIHVYEESIQTGEFSDYRNAWDYYTNPLPEVSGEAVSS